MHGRPSGPPFHYQTNIAQRRFWTYDAAGIGINSNVIENLAATSCGYGPGTPSHDAAIKLAYQNIITHEMGHAIGLVHFAASGYNHVMRPGNELGCQMFQTILPIHPNIAFALSKYSDQAASYFEYFEQGDGHFIQFEDDRSDFNFENQ